MKLSKTDFLIFKECQKNAWLKIHRPDIYFKYPLSAFEKNIIETGNEIDEMARQLFPGGVLVKSREDSKSTQKLIAERTSVIYQPVFASEKFLAVSDILVWNKETEKYDLYEVKSSTVSEEDGGRKTEDYLVDMAFQKRVILETGIMSGEISLGQTYLVRLNKEYIRRGELNVFGLFKVENLTKEVDEILKEIGAEMDSAFEVLSSEKEPPGHCGCILKGRGSHCTTSEYSNADIPEYSVHDIARIGNSKKKLKELVDSSILNIADIPQDFELSEIQRRQVDTAQSGRTYIDRAGISEFLATIKYPVAFLDYETYPSALPRFDGYRPYQQIPFQFSLHVMEKPGGELLHYDFIHAEDTCPDEAFVSSLQKDLPKFGSILVWNMKFEKGINAQIAERQPKFAKFLKEVNDRVVDLMIPFYGKTLVYDHPKFYGSASIKYVLPALVPELSYKNLHIQEGGTASDTWNRIVSGEYGAEEKECEIRALLDYCGQDTLAMVEIWRVLEGESK
ncbi:MAG TPA: DUF2779 domain-containing protein [Candidatus Paceibacterota bacterium]|nr:DUF2779 domain-containing protein [Candidatus Paceibacterota bacterium]HRZ34645.1 DUF2779 domain-containing protein [Candidatus Paceibacterota bacterium]